MPLGPDNPHDDYGFDADGRPVPTVEPEIFFDDPPPETVTRSRGGMTLPQFIDFAMGGRTTLEEIGAIVVLAAYSQPECFHRPKSLRELAIRLDCTHPTARKKFTTFLAENIGDSGD